jgi:UDP-N-acetylglucosamine acyltransferase
VTAAGYPAKPAGTNNEGLRRRGFSVEDIATVRRAYRTLYRAGLSLDDARAALAREAQTQPLIAPLVEFLAESRRGIVR